MCNNVLICLHGASESYKTVSNNTTSATTTNNNNITNNNNTNNKILMQSFTDRLGPTSPESERSKGVKSDLLRLIWRQRAVTWLIHKYFHNDVKHI